MTDTVKEKVEEMALKQGIEKLKFTNKQGVTLMHHDWIAGVDYDVLNDEEGQPTDDIEVEDDENDRQEGTQRHPTK